MSALPPCPLCEAEPDHGALQFPGGNVWCPCEGCPLYSVQIPVASWRRLASPALPPTLTAVLEAAFAQAANVMRTFYLDIAINNWIAAGRSGLPRAAEKKP